jgi:hypothetical protein
MCVAAPQTAQGFAPALTRLGWTRVHRPRSALVAVREPSQYLIVDAALHSASEGENETSAQIEAIKGAWTPN